MYDFFYKLNRRFSTIAALVMLLGLVITPLGEFLGINNMAVLIMYATILGGTVLLDRKLEKLMTAEAWKESLGVDLEAASDKIFQEEKARRRKEGRPF